MKDKSDQAWIKIAQVEKHNSKELRTSTMSYNKRFTKFCRSKYMRIKSLFNHSNLF